MSSFRCFRWVLLLMLALCAPAHAHVSFEGGEEIWGGMAHPVLTPPHIILIITLALFLGQRLPLDLRMPMLVFSITSAASLALTVPDFVKEPGQVVVLSIAMAIAALVALEKRGPQWACGILCGGAAAAIGFDSGIRTGSLLLDAKVLLGTWISMNILTAYLSFVSSHAGKHPIARTGVRVLAAWIIAIALLMLAFSLKR